MSTGRFVLRPSAAANLDAIEDYLSENASADIAEAFFESITDALRLLAGQPEMGRPWASSLPRLHDVRAWPLRIHHGYLILYRPLTAERGIEVLYVFHGARDILALLDEDEP